MSTLLPSVEVCEQARLSRDARFDGVFFTAVRSTGIYCRPVCPAPAPKAEHVEYHPTTASAEAAGFRPCLRCRPELSPGAAWRRGDGLIARALRLIDRAQPDAPTDLPVHLLAEQLHVSERHLRRLFQDSLGASPQQIQATRRLLFAKQLLTETRLPITQVAEAAGFSSLRRFNDAFLRAYRMPPSRLRRRQQEPVDATATGKPDHPLAGKTSAKETEPDSTPIGTPSGRLSPAQRGEPERSDAPYTPYTPYRNDGPHENDTPDTPEALTLRLAYRPPFDFAATLAFLQRRALPGIEDISDTHYARVIDDSGAWLDLRA